MAPEIKPSDDMQVRIKSDGTCYGTHVYGPDGSELGLVQSFRIAAGPADGANQLITAVVELQGVALDVVAQLVGGGGEASYDEKKIAVAHLTHLTTRDAIDWAHSAETHPATGDGVNKSAILDAVVLGHRVTLACTHDQCPQTLVYELCIPPRVHIKPSGGLQYELANLMRLARAVADKGNG